MFKNHKITEKAPKKCAPKDLFTFASDDVIPGKPLIDDSSENTEFKRFRFLDEK